MAQLAEATQLFQQARAEFGAASPDYAKVGQRLARLKVLLTSFSYLLPADAQTNVQELVLAREVLELGALYSVRVKDIPSFERYFNQLKTYYYDLKDKIPESQRYYPLLGLNLLRLLAQNKIAEFHTELEVLDPSVLLENIYLKYPVQIEQCLMEGSYNKVWHSRHNTPSDDFAFFLDILMDTIRNEIASCSEKAYTSLPVADAATLLYFKTKEELLKFAQQRGWTASADQRIYFTQDVAEKSDIPAQQVMRMALGYARELERIV